MGPHHLKYGFEKGKFIDFNEKDGFLIMIKSSFLLGTFWLSHLKSALNSSVVSVATTVGDRLFQWGIVLGEKEYFRASCNHVSGTPFMENSTICARNNILS